MGMSDEEIVEYLMTSDFNDGHTEEEFRFLLLKFRTLYRLLKSKNEQINHSLNTAIMDFEEFRVLNTDMLIKANEDVFLLQNTLEQELNRKLTLKERFTGKLIRHKKEIEE